MDRDDARFIVEALEARLGGDPDAIAELRASSFGRLFAAAARLRVNANGWPPALAAALELEGLGRGTSDAEPSADLTEFLKVMRGIAGEAPAPRNRHERRHAARIQLPRRARLVGARSLVSIH